MIQPVLQKNAQTSKMKFALSYRTRVAVHMNKKYTSFGLIPIRLSLLSMHALYVTLKSWEGLAGEDTLHLRPFLRLPA